MKCALCEGKISRDLYKNKKKDECFPCPHCEGRIKRDFYYNKSLAVLLFLCIPILLFFIAETSSVNPFPLWVSVALFFVSGAIGVVVSRFFLRSRVCED